MAEKIHFKFYVGDKAICVEGGSGYGRPQLYDGMTMSIRQAGKGGKVGARDGVKFYVRRNEMAAIGMAFLDVAKKMAPETLWARSETVASHGAQQRRVLPLTVQEDAELLRAFNDKEFDLLPGPAAAFDKLRRRMHILQRMQYLLERVDDTVADQLDLVLALTEQQGALPFGVAVIGIASDEVVEAAPGGQTH